MYAGNSLRRYKVQGQAQRVVHILFGIKKIDLLT